MSPTDRPRPGPLHPLWVVLLLFAGNSLLGCAGSEPTAEELLEDYHDIGSGSCSLEQAGGPTQTFRLAGYLDIGAPSAVSDAPTGCELHLSIVAEDAGTCLLCLEDVELTNTTLRAGVSEGAPPVEVGTGVTGVCWLGSSDRAFDGHTADGTFTFQRASESSQLRFTSVGESSLIELLDDEVPTTLACSLSAGRAP